MGKLGKLGSLSRISASLVAAVVFAAVLVLLFSSFGTGQQGPPPCPWAPALTGSFVLHGNVLNSSFHNATTNSTSTWNASVNVSIYNMSFSQFGEPQTTFINQTTTNASSGNFTLNVGPGSCMALYTVKVVAYNATSWNAWEVGPTLPPVPMGALMAFLDNSTIYLQPAVTFYLTAWNGSAMVNFSNLVFDDALGFPISEDFMTLRFNTTIVVPRAKNYTIMVMRPPQFNPGDPNPFNLALPPQTIVVNNISNFSEDLKEIVLSFNKSLAFSMNVISGNITVEGNSTAVNITQLLVKLGVAGMVPPNSDLQISGGNVINQTPPGTGNYAANYSAVVMGSASGIYQILEVYGANATATSSGGGEYFAYFSNFTVTGNIAHNLTLKRLAGNYSSVSSGSTTLNASFVKINISDANGLPLDDAHTEIKVDMVGHRSVFPTFRYMVDQLSGGIVSLPILNDSNATLLIFNRQFAPMKVKLNITNASKEPNGIIRVTLNTFKPKKFNANGSSEQFSGALAGNYKLTFMRNSQACNVFNASVDSCRLFPNDFDAGGFNPLKVMATGKVNLLMEINTTGVKVYFIGVDMLASGPPEASMSDSALRADTNGTSYQELFKFGSAAPNIYDKVLVGMPYNYSRLDDSQQINFTIKELFDDTGSLAWNSTQNQNAQSVPSDWSDYNASWFNTTSGGMPCVGSGGNDTSTSKCYINTSTNYVWINLPHFSDGSGGPQGSDSTPPAAPALVNISATIGGNVVINWTDVPSETGESYIIFRSASNISTLWNNLTNYSDINYVINITNLTSAARIGEGVQTYIDNTTLNGSIFYYAVAAVDATGNLQNSSSGGGVNLSSVFNRYNATVNDTVMPRSALNITITTSDTSVTITWLNVTQDVNGEADSFNLTYQIYRSAANETNVNLAAGNNVTQANLTTFVKSVSGTTNSTSVSGFVKGTYHFAVVPADDGGNVNFTVFVPSKGPFGNYANISVTPSASTGSSPGSSPGGGGGGGGTPAPDAGIKVSKKWDVMPAGTSTMSISKEEISFKNLDITTVNSASNVELTVTKLATSPTVKREVQGKVYQYIKIDKANLKDTDVSEVKIEFKVEKKWFDQNSGSIKNIVLQRYFNDLWTSLDTVYKRSDTTDNYFEATSPGLSLFAVVLKPAAASSAAETAAAAGPVNVSAAAGNVSGNETGEAGKGKGGTGKTLLFVIIGLVVAAIGGGAFFIIKKKGGGMGGGFSFPNPFSKLGKGGRGSGRGGKGKSRDAEEAAEIVREYESQRSERSQQQDQRGRPPEAFN
ncbi:PGF-pre-PGF domain-containing protein [Candidatus Woesearchaeota archaeon]|nr:PGF-pre-PGF domain-containing protein [Candidatus Woesearchaeota archaeon]